MTKSNGLGDNLYIAGYDLSGDINSLGNISGSQATLETTGIDKSAYERIGGVRSGNIDFTSYFNTTADQAHPVLKTLPTTDVILTYARGTTHGNPAACMVAKQVNYDGTRGNDGDFKFNVQALSNGYGLEWGEQATAGKRTDSAATPASGASNLDNAASGTNGLQAYLQAFSIGSGTATVKIQESDDDSTYADLTGGAFTNVTGKTSERIAVTGNVKRYLKVVTTGTFTNLVFSVVIVRNQVAVTF